MTATIPAALVLLLIFVLLAVIHRQRPAPPAAPWAFNWRRETDRLLRACWSQGFMGEPASPEWLRQRYGLPATLDIKPLLLDLRRLHDLKTLAFRLQAKSDPAGNQVLEVSATELRRRAAEGVSIRLKLLGLPPASPFVTAADIHDRDQAAFWAWCGSAAGDSPT